MQSIVNIIDGYAEIGGVLFEGKCGQSTVRLEDLAITMGEMPEHGRRYRVETNNDNGSSWGLNHETIAEAAETVAFTIRTKLVFV